MIRSAARLFPRNVGAANVLGPSTLRVVLYHHVTDAPCDATDLLGVSTPVSIFAEHLRYFEAHYQIIGLDEVLAGRLPERPLLITFDDCYRSVLSNAVPLLRDRSLPAVFFVSPLPVIEQQLMLDNFLCLLVNRYGIARVSGAIGGSAAGVRSLAALIQGPISQMGPAARAATRARLEVAFDFDDCGLVAERGLYLRYTDLPSLVSSGIEIANHTASHVHCRSLSPDDAEAEIVVAGAELTKSSGQQIRAFSFPYGSSDDATVVACSAIRRSGAKTAFLVEGCANACAGPSDIWYRVGLTQQHPRELFAELEVLPRLRRLRNRWIRREPAGRVDS